MFYEIVLFIIMTFDQKHCLMTLDGKNMFIADVIIHFILNKVVYYGFIIS